MNSRTFRNNVLVVITLYGLFILLLVELKVGHLTKPEHYDLAKDVMPLAIAMPAAWLGYCVQRRMAYLKDARDFWSKLLPAVQDAIQLTHASTPSLEEYAKALRGMSIAIDEARALFFNVGERENSAGLFPFEGLKHIHAVLSKIRPDQPLDPAQGRAARGEIVAGWKNVRNSLICELARTHTAKPDSPYFE